MISLAGHCEPMPALTRTRSACARRTGTSASAGAACSNRSGLEHQVLEPKPVPCHSVSSFRTRSITMLSSDALRRRLDSNFENAQQDLDSAALNMDAFSPEDWHAFNSAIRQSSTASWAANQEIVVKHNLAKAIINEIR
uniref:HrpF n=1 Tax=Pseudomonas viridiflava TaxID=33069 RepID=I6LD49_PSEVI|nr:HrpF [Pseudomonas viridiflava]